MISADDVDILEQDIKNPLANSLYSYCMNNPINQIDPDGYFALALASGGYLASSWALGGANFWNPVGWGILITATVVTIGLVSYKVYESSKKSTKNKKQSKKSGKDKASDAPDWAKRQNYDPNKSANENAKRVLDDKYGKGKWKSGSDSEYSKIKKWLERSKGY